MHADWEFRTGDRGGNGGVFNAEAQRKRRGEDGGGLRIEGECTLAGALTIGRGLRSP